MARSMTRNGRPTAARTAANVARGGVSPSAAMSVTSSSRSAPLLLGGDRVLRAERDHLQQRALAHMTQSFDDDMTRRTSQQA